MLRLKILLRGAQISDLSLDPDKEYVGGRKESCDIRLQAEKGVSREHFKLKFEDHNWVVSSLSRFGEIYYQGQRVENSALSVNQTFQIPPYEFLLVEEAGAEISSIVRKKTSDVNENEKTVIGIVQQVPYIKMMSAQGEVREMLRLEVGDTWVAGRDPSCQIIIPDQRVSRRQFELRKINGIYTIIDLASVNGTFLNGSPVSSTDPQALKSGDALTVLDNTMYFELHDPNFQYRVDKIEIPPLQPIYIDEVAEDYAENPANISASIINSLQEVEQQQYGDQLNPNGGPFTGMPNNQNQNNEYYNFQNAEQQQPFSPSADRWNKFKENKPLFISTILILLVGVYFLSEMINEPQQQITNRSQVDAADPFLRLTPEEQQQVISKYTFAEKAIKQQQFTIARENLEQLHKILETGYKDSKVYELEAQNGEQTIITQQEAERRAKEEAEQEIKIKETADLCEKLITPEVTKFQIEECLAPITVINPDHPDRLRLIADVDKIVSDRTAVEEREKLKQTQIETLRSLFQAAETIQATGYPKRTLSAYQKVLDAELPDPENLKKIAGDRVKYIKRRLAQKNTKYLTEADDFIKSGKIRDAIKSLQGALSFDPDNETIKSKIDKHTNELNLQVKSLYQDSIIDENFGNVDGSESRPGAKDKWKKIIETDLEDGDYYRKAFIKLKKYGVF